MVEAVDKRARLNCTHDLLGHIPCEEVPRDPITLPERVRNPEYIRGRVPKEMYLPAVY